MLKLHSTGLRPLLITEMISFVTKRQIQTRCIASNKPSRITLEDYTGADRTGPARPGGARLGM